MSKTDDCLAYVKAHPGSIVVDIAAGVSMKVPDCSGRMKCLLDRGLVTRQPAGTTLSGVTRYAYTACEVPIPRVPSLIRQKRMTRDKKTISQGVSERQNTPTHTLEGLIDSLAQQIAKQVASQIKAHLPKELTALLPSQSVCITDTNAGEVLPSLPVPAVPSRKPKIAVVGLLPAQAGHITREFEGVATLYFPDKGRADQLRQAAANCKVVFVMTKFVSHSTTEVLSGCHGAEVMLIPGGLSDLRRVMKGVLP